MKNLMKIEEFFLFGLALFLFSKLDYGWVWYIVFFFAADLSILGYLVNPGLGAWIYNLIHHKGVSVALYLSGALFSISWLMFAGTVLLGHSSLDRVFGYGLKYPDSFKATHLGVIGKQSEL